jgi:hypothetical protein
LEKGEEMVGISNIFNLRIVSILITINLTFTSSLYARRVRIVQITNEWETVFKISPQEKSKLSAAIENLWLAVEHNDDLFHYYINRIKELSTPHVLLTFIQCVAAVREKQNVNLIFDLIQEFRRSNAGDYFINGTLEDIRHLPDELGNIEGGFQILMNALITITGLTEEDHQPEAYNFLRRFREEIIIDNWINHRYIREHFARVIKKIVDIRKKGLEQNMWNALNQINIYLNDTNGNWKETENRLDEFYQHK